MNLPTADLSSSSLIKCLSRSVIGTNRVISTPYRPRRMFYADYTASARSLRFIEDFIQDEVLTMYANTHTEASGTGRQTTKFREEARDIIEKHVHANSKLDAVIFTGSGCTAAVNKLVHAMNLRLPKDLDIKFNLKASIPREARPVVFIGPYEHHSNELPWRESICDVVVIEEDEDGLVDLNMLRKKLEEYKSRPLMIGSFSAASNVTGILTNVRTITLLLHEYGALAFWDYAACAPYIEINMNPYGDEVAEKYQEFNDVEDPKYKYWRERPYHSSDNPAALDAVFISPHKFIGGPNTPGVLVCKRELLESGAPDSPGGGTVLFVNPGSHDYYPKAEVREEGGTPDIVGSVRAGLVFQLKQTVGIDNIVSIEEKWLAMVFKRFSQNPKIRILGNTETPRLAIISFMIREPDSLVYVLKRTQDQKKSVGRFLHHNFVVALLNDVFGIQARGGCSCAGPYQHRLLGLAPEVSLSIRDIRRVGVNGITPGWARLNFHYIYEEKEVAFLIEAVEWIAEHGWKLVPDYDFDPLSGLWTHKKGHPKLDISLHNLNYSSGSLEYDRGHGWTTSDACCTYLEEANEIVKNSLNELKVQDFSGISKRYNDQIDQHVAVTSAEEVKKLAESGMTLRSSGWLRLDEEQRRTQMYICSDGSCAATWGEEISKAELNRPLLGVRPVGTTGHCQVVDANALKPNVTQGFIDAYERLRWFSTPSEVVEAHRRLSGGEDFCI